MKVTKTNLEMVRGDTLAFIFELIPSYGEEEYTLDSAYFSVRTNPNSSNYIFQKALSDGITSMGNNKYRVVVDPEDTENLDEDIYSYDLEITLDGQVKTILLGMLKIVDDITRGVAE